MPRSLLNYVGPILLERMLRGPCDVGNGFDRHELEGRTQTDLLMRPQSSEALVGLDQLATTIARPCGHPVAFDLAPESGEWCPS